MIHQLAATASFVPPVVPAAPHVLYTVPSPKGKQAGVGRDGRLHILTFAATPAAAGNMSTLCLAYLADDGSLLGLFPDPNYDSSVPNTHPVYTTWARQPEWASFGGIMPGNAVGVTPAWGLDFIWLQAGCSIGMAQLDTGFSWSVTVLGMLVEDFGGLAEGDEYDVGGQRDAQVGSTFLFPDAD